MIIDAHHHVWDPRTAQHAWLDELPRLNRPFSLADFEQASAPEGVTASVLVQVLPSAAETAEFLALADRSAGRIAGVVGWADLPTRVFGKDVLPWLVEHSARVYVHNFRDSCVGTNVVRRNAT